MEKEERILNGHSDLEKGAYLGAIASLATADREASEEEMEHIAGLCDAAGLSEQQKEHVLRAATELSGEELNQCLDVLKNSELRYSLVADLIAFARADTDYNEAEQKSVHQIAQYLGVSEKQFSLLDQFAEKAAVAEVPEEKKTDPEFLSSTGLKDKMQSAGINTGSLLTGLLGIAGPMLLASMMSRRRMGGFGYGSGFGGGMMGGGIGSIIGMLSGGRGFSGTGGLLGRMMGGRRW